MVISIKCLTGYKMPIENFSIFDPMLKKHSNLEIERLEKSIVEDGFLFPISVGIVKVAEHSCRAWSAYANYIAREYEPVW